jgi:hypothetical protein
MTQPIAEQAPRKKTWLVVVFVIAGIFGFILLIGVPLAIFGVRKYLIEAKTSEGRNVVTALAQGIARCHSAEAAGRFTLPPSARPVPRDLASVQGMRYQSAPADWQDEAYSCARFQLTDPQYFQYQWVRTSPNHGIVRALADLNGDADPEIQLEAEVTCADGAACTVGQLREGSKVDVQGG